MLNAQEKTRLKVLQAKIDAARNGGASVDLTEDDERFLDLVALKSEKQNIRKKALAGGTLTGAQRARLSRSLVEGEAEVDDGVTYVQTWEELADAIPINSKTLENFRKDHADLIRQYKKDLIRSDERKCVPEWRALLAECGIRGRGDNNPNSHGLDARQLDLEERRFKLDTAKFKFELAKKLQMPIADFEAALGPMLAQFRTSLNALPGRGTGKILNRARTAILNMLRAQLTEKQFAAVDRAMSDAKTASVEYSDIEEVLQAEVDLVLRTIEGCDYLQVADEEAE